MYPTARCRPCPFSFFSPVNRTLRDCRIKNEGKRCGTPNCCAGLRLQQRRAPPSTPRLALFMPRSGHTLSCRPQQRDTMQAPSPSAYLQFAGLSVPLVEPCACRDLQSAPVTHCAGRLRCRNPFRLRSQPVPGRGETMRATKAYRANTNCRKLRMPQVETLYRCSPTVSQIRLSYYVSVR